MKILHIMASRGFGGAETYATDVMLSLHDEGVEQIVVMHPRAPRYEEIVAAGIKTAPDILRIPFQPLQRFLLRRLLKREKPDIVHCWMRRAASLMPPAYDTPVIGWFGGYYDPKHFQSCSHFVGVTRDIVQHMVEKGVPEAFARFIPTFPDVKPEPPVDKRKLDTPPDAKVVLALSRLHPKKGLDTLLEAVKKLGGVYVWLAGEGPLREELEVLAQKLGMQDRVRFLGWRTDRGALLRAADVCALPSRYEPFGTVILEAWAAGTPLVAAKSAGPLGHIEDGRNGLLVPIDDSTALSAALRRALEDQDLRRSLRAEGFASYLAGYTREAVTAQMIAYYQSLLKQDSGG
jgi:hypothetical protein